MLTGLSIVICEDFGSSYTYCDDGYYCCANDKCWYVQENIRFASDKIISDIYQPAKPRRRLFFAYILYRLGALILIVTLKITGHKMNISH